MSRDSFTAEETAALVQEGKKALESFYSVCKDESGPRNIEPFYSRGIFARRGSGQLVLVCFRDHDNDRDNIPAPWLAAYLDGQGRPRASWFTDDDLEFIAVPPPAPTVRKPRRRLTL